MFMYATISIYNGRRIETTGGKKTNMNTKLRKKRRKQQQNEKNDGKKECKLKRAKTHSKWNKNQRQNVTCDDNICANICSRFWLPEANAFHTHIHTRRHTLIKTSSNILSIPMRVGGGCVGVYERLFVEHPIRNFDSDRTKMFRKSILMQLKLILAIILDSRVNNLRAPLSRNQKIKSTSFNR